MATGFEKLDEQIDRLGKLFSRKKRAADSHDPGVARNRPATPIPFLTGLDATLQTFPEPSFIRPTSSRMVAREEVMFTAYSTRRARSLPESPRTPRLTAPSFRTDTGSDCPAIPARYSSLGSTIDQRSSSLYPASSIDGPPSELMEFSFSPASRESECASSPRRRSRPSSKPLIRSPSVSVSPKARDRKRYLASTQDKVCRPQVQESRVCKQSTRQHKNPGLAPLQRDSHCLGPASGAYLAPPLLPRPVPLAKPSRDEHHGKSQRPRSLSISGSNIKHVSEALRKATSLSNLLTAKDPKSDPTLKEPSVKDFLALSDDDIADGHAASRTQPPASSPPTFALPPNPSPAPTPVRTKPAPTKPSYPLLTLSPPLASRPAAEAAIEAARIATKYQFDLVYVVNMWPKHMSRPGRFCGTSAATSPARTATPSPPESPVSHTSGYDSGFESRTPAPRDNPTRSGAATGRLMAAYGLPSIMYPFRISAPVHQKVLRTQGWLEYRNDSGAQDEFARGYSCSFYTGYSPARGREPDRTATTTPDGGGKPKSNPPNRGLVFAAFRVPREDGTPVCSSAAELEALHKDAEALVDMLIDHVRAPPTPSSSRRCVAGPHKGRMMIKTGAPLVAI